MNLNNASLPWNSISVWQAAREWGSTRSRAEHGAPLSLCGFHRVHREISMDFAVLPSQILIWAIIGMGTLRSDWANRNGEFSPSLESLEMSMLVAKRLYVRVVWRSTEHEFTSKTHVYWLMFWVYPHVFFLNFMWWFQFLRQSLSLRARRGWKNKTIGTGKLADEVFGNLYLFLKIPRQGTCLWTDSKYKHY